jgi:6-phosphogluconolactonase
MTHLPFFISSLCSGQGPAIYSASLDPATGGLHSLTPIPSPLQNAFFITVSADRSRLYATDFVKQFQGQPTAAVHCLQITNKTLAPIAAQPADDTAPCFLTLSHDQQSLFCAGYGQGSVTRFALSHAQGLSHPHPVITPAKVPGLHAHCVLIHPTQNFLLSTFLGLDHITSHALAPDGSLSLIDALSLPAKSGPRHLAWHPSGRFLFALTETSSHILSIAFDPSNGKLTLLDTQSALPASFSGTSRAADILVHPSGRFIYGSNRGHESIATFEFSPATGRLTFLNHTPTPGGSPQCLRLDPTGQFLLTALIKSHRVTSHRIDPDTGTLSLIDGPLDVPSPSCLAFYNP